MKEKKIKFSEKDKLRARYKYDEDEKRKDLVVTYPLGKLTQNDASYLIKVFTNEFLMEMINRGYDIDTLKFEICPKLPNFKFETLTKKYGAE